MNWKMPITNAPDNANSVPPNPAGAARRCASHKNGRAGGSSLPRFFIGALLLLATPLFATPADDYFKNANALYDTGKFAEAADALDKLHPKTAHIHFNIGNACFRQDKLGLALLHYERARRLAPRDPDILANLRFAEQRLAVDDVNAPAKPFRRFLLNTVRSRTTTEWDCHEIAALWLTAATLAACFFLPRWRTGCIVVASAITLIWVTVTAALAAAVTTPPDAIVTVAKTEVRFAPMPEATVHFNVTEGTRVAVLEERGNWLQIERADGKQGFLPRSTVTAINAP
jgi:tetratricopeptide (TPR) repeat protein